MQAWRRSTWSKYKGHFYNFSFFCFLHGWDPMCPEINTIISYTQSLIKKNVKYGTINNHLSGIKTVLSWHGCSSTIWNSPKLLWNRKSARNTLRCLEPEQSVMDFEHLLVCLVMTEDTCHAPIHLALILGFFGLLRVSNFKANNLNEMDKSRNMQLQDITEKNNSLHILIIWSKSNQFSSDKLVLPKTNTPLLCPVTAWRKYKYDYLENQGKDDDPILLYKLSNKLVPMSADKLCSSFRALFNEAGFGNLHYTPHSLRRGGATFFANKGVPLPSIKRHGFWRSEAIEVYLRNMSSRGSPIYNCIKSL